ncbi:MAG: hypothetical protein IJB80_00165 [Clostridia bacterium]|nr:hypothetical protein [Clostridia bacterium]
MKNERFHITLDPRTGCVSSIMITDDPHQMNWCLMPHQWGSLSLQRPTELGRRNDAENTLLEFSESENESVSVYSNNRIKTTVKRNFTSEGNFKESYTFQNILNTDILLRKGELGIYTPFRDEQKPAPVSLTQCSHTHIWCGESEAWLNALRQGDSKQNLGLVLTEGSIDAYSIDGDNARVLKGTRGCILLHPEAVDLLPGESLTISWELFVHQGKEDFTQKILSYGKLLPVAPRYTVFAGEPITFTFSTDAKDVRITLRNEEIPYTRNGTTVSVSYLPQKEGEHTFRIVADNKHTHINVWATAAFEEVLKRRIDFIVDHQQYHREGSQLDGAYLIYDTEEKRLYYDSLFSDHNACRERLGMALLIARYLQSHQNEKFYQSLMQFVTFVKREVLEVTTGQVFNEVGKDPSFLRLYNAPWMITLMAELFFLTKEEEYLDIIHKAVKFYYGQGGGKFYPNGLSMELTINALKEGNKPEYLNDVLGYFRQHVQNMIEVGLNYPEMECVYEQTIVTSPATYIPEMGLITGDPSYGKHILDHLAVLDRFSGMQPDFRNNEMAIRFWDDYWFGKGGLYLDTLHYWCCLTARSFSCYSRLTGEQSYQEKAENCIRNCFCLFKADGSASCNLALPFAVDNHPGDFFDAWANDQDFALYFAMQIL